MDMLTILIWVLVGFIVLTCIVLLVLFRKEIDAFLRPSLYSYIIFIESDNTIVQWLQKKTANLTFKFNKGTYNMFDKIISNTQSLHEKALSTVYKKGRLNCFVYNEGNPNPLDIRHMTSKGNPYISYQLERTQISDLFNSDETPLSNFMKNIMPLIIAFLIFIVIVLILVKSQGTPTP